MTDQEQIVIKGARLSFPSIFKRSMYEGKEGKYEATLLIPKDNEQVVKMLKGKIKGKMDENKVKKISSERICLKDGDDIYDEKGDKYEAYKGHYSLKASNNSQPKVVDRRMNDVSEDDNVIYGGCYVNAIISLWYQNNAYGKRINANLLAVQFVEDGEPFGSGPIDVTGGFEVLEEDEFGDDELAF